MQLESMNINVPQQFHQIHSNEFGRIVIKKTPIIMEILMYNIRTLDFFCIKHNNTNGIQNT